MRERRRGTGHLPEEAQSIVKEYEETSPESLEAEPESALQECTSRAETDEEEIKCFDKYGGS